MAILERDGVQLSYAVHGPLDGQTPLLLTHGYGASAGMWAANLPALCASRPVLTWDLRGHGGSDAPDDQARYSHDASVEDMAALLEAVEAPRAVVGGMSLGGFLSLAFHLRHPERVAGLLLVDCGPGYRDDAAREGWNRWARELADQLEEVGLGALPGSVEVATAAHAHGVRGLARAARGMLVQRDSAVIDSLPGISVPTLIVVGARDAPFLAAADAMAKRIPGARKVVLDGAGHAANMDRPEQFDSEVLDFLEEL